MAKYTSEKNILTLIALLKQHGIRRIIASPGTTNISFVASVQSDPFFELVSCVDERSAAYMACGIAAETGEPVVLTCTGATASRNYAPGLTEAYYRKLPVIAVTATQHLGRVGQNVAQVLDRSKQFNDMVKKSIQLYEVHTAEDAWACNLALNDVLLEARRNGGGPVHINMVTTYSNDFSIGELPTERMIERLTYVDDMPQIKSSKVAIFVGNHRRISDELTREIEEFCEKYNGVVLCDHPSGYHGKYKILPNLVTMQPASVNFKNIDFLIDLGEVSGIYAGLSPRNVWRVSEDGEIRDTFKVLSKVFEMDEATFFKRMNALKSEKVELTYYTLWRQKFDELNDKIDDDRLPFSNPWIARQVSSRLVDGDKAHLGILNTLRSWDLREIPVDVDFYCNTGGFGIDGVMSTAFGNSLVTSNRVFCFIGDLAFFYDLNSIGNRNLNKNLRILLVNNGCGTEFHNFNHRAVAVSSENHLSPEYFAADGHFGNQSKKLVRHYAEDLGFDYLSASNKQDFMKNLEKFMTLHSSKPILFEVFTDSKDESNALDYIYHLEKEPMKKLAKKVLGSKGKKIVKKLLKK